MIKNKEKEKFYAENQKKALDILESVGKKNRQGFATKRSVETLKSVTSNLLAEHKIVNLNLRHKSRGSDYVDMMMVNSK